MRVSLVLLTLMLLLVACARSQPTATLVPAPTASPTPVPSPTATVKVPTVASTTATPVPTATRVFPSTPTATSRPTLATPTPSPLDRVFGQILDRVSDIRGLEPLAAIHPMFMTREQMVTTLREDLDESREDILDSQALMKILGLVPQDGDLYQMLLDLYSEQVIGFYDPETEELYVIKGIEELTPMDAVTLAHEYVHALQQQHFDIHSLMEEVEDDSEAEAALVALIEGDATMVQFEYLSTYLTSQERQEVLGAGGDSPVFDSSPYVLQQSLLFPYSQGLLLVNSLLSFGEWSGVDNAYGDAPVSSEQVLHPEKYLEREMPVPVSLPDVATALGQGWEEVYGDVMGEFFLRTYLETRTGSGAAALAAAGWGGDRFGLLEGPNGEQALVVLLAWDSEGDALEFFDALNSFDSVSIEGFLGIQEDRVLWVLSPSRAMTDSIRAVFDGF